MKELSCKHCNRLYIYDYRSKMGHTKNYCNSCNSNYRRFAVMKKCIDYKGGKCSICGYNKCMRSLVFHHRNPETKTFGISGNYNLKWELLQQELDKCDLICANCHGEIHDIESKSHLFDFEKPKVIKKEFKKICVYCKKGFNSSRKNTIYCDRECRLSATTKVTNRPTLEELQEMLKKQTMVSIGRKYNVTDNTVRKWIKQYKAKIGAEIIEISPLTNPVNSFEQSL